MVGEYCSAYELNKTMQHEDFTTFVTKLGGKISSCEKSAGPVKCQVHMT